MLQTLFVMCMCCCFTFPFSSIYSPSTACRHCHYDISPTYSNSFVNPEYFHTLRKSIRFLALRIGIVKFAYYQHLCVRFLDYFMRACAWVNRNFFPFPSFVVLLCYFIENISTHPLPTEKNNNKKQANGWIGRWELSNNQYTDIVNYRNDKCSKTLAHTHL